MTLKRFNPVQRPKKAVKDRPHVLYIEDNDGIWEVSKLALKADYEMSRARNSEEALAELTCHAFDIILCDIQLKGSELDGTEIVKRLRSISSESEIAKTKPDTPVVFITAYGDRFSENELRAVGGDDVMYKPVDYERLSLLVSQLAP